MPGALNQLVGSHQRIPTSGTCNINFIGARTYRKPSYHLLNVKQGTQESLKSYVQRFNAESLKVDVPDEKFTIAAFIASIGVQSKDLMFSIS